MTKSALQIARAAYQPKLPKALKGAVKAVAGAATQSVADQEAIKALFPNTYGMPLITFEAGEAVQLPAMNVGVILSGGQAPGGHNVICGLYDALKATNADNVLYGFKKGPSGLIEDDYLIFDDEYINQYRNTGGFDIIGSGRTKLETKEQFAVAAEVCKKHGIDEYEAMNMYSYLQKMHKGQSWLVRYKPLEYLERVLTLAKEAYASYMNNGLILSMVNFGDKYTKILVIFEKDGVRSQQEFDLR